MATLVEIMEALAAQLHTGLADAVEGLQVERRMIPNPSPPVIDMYPGDPFQEQIAYSYVERELLLILRARVTTIDNVAGQELLLAMMDMATPESVLAAVGADKTLGGLVGSTVLEGSSGYTRYPADAVGSSDLLGCEWRTRIIL